MSRKRKNRIDALVRSEIARWPQWAMPYGVSKDELEAIQSRRDDYASRIVTALGILEDNEDVVLRAVGGVLGLVREGPRTQGTPEVEQIIRDVRRRLRPKSNDEIPDCAECVKQGGRRAFVDDEDVAAIERAVYGPWLNNGPSRALCTQHHEEAVYFMAHDAWREGRLLKIRGVPAGVSVQVEPKPPTSLRTRPRLSDEASDKLKRIIGPHIVRD